MKPKTPPLEMTKMLTGIQGFDDITAGGLPRARTSLVMGGSGSGKTVFALQALVNGARTSKEAGIFVAFEESPRQIIANAATFGWDLPELEKKKLFFLDAHLAPDVVRAGDFDLLGMLAILEAKAKAIHAKRIVFDGIDVLLSLLDDRGAERREMYRLRDWLVRTGLSAIITQKVTGTDADQRYGFVQFMIDCVVVLRHEVVDGSAFRNLRVVKYRGSSFAGDEFPIALDAAGLQLTHRGPTELAYAVTDERVSSGLARLDDMLHGGYFRGSAVLVSGAPGTAKSTLAGLFAAAACARGERTLYVSFDAGAAQIVRDLRSVGIRLAPHVASGLLDIYSTRTHGPNVEDQFAELRMQVVAHAPRCLVIDPLSALSTTRTHVASVDAAQQFLDFLKGERITVVHTALTDRRDPDEAVESGMSSMSDAWIHLSYVAQEGERNRALTIMKSRGSGHSNQLLELTLSDRGVALSDVFVAEGKVLMGAARAEWERRERAAATRRQVASDARRLQLELAQAEAHARLRLIEAEIAAHGAEVALLVAAAAPTSPTAATRGAKSAAKSAGRRAP